jgi:hypothetical protein
LEVAFLELDIAVAIDCQIEGRVEIGVDRAGEGDLGRAKVKAVVGRAVAVTAVVVVVAVSMAVGGPTRGLKRLSDQGAAFASRRHVSHLPSWRPFDC